MAARPRAQAAWRPALALLRARRVRLLALVRPRRCLARLPPAARVRGARGRGELRRRPQARHRWPKLRDLAQFRVCD